MKRKLELRIAIALLGLAVVGKVSTVHGQTATKPGGGSPSETRTRSHSPRDAQT